MNYKKLKVWQKAHKNSLRAIEVIKKNDNKRFDFVSKQFLRSITSVSANIAEGSGDFKGKEFTRFLNVALRSAFETDNWINLIKDVKITKRENLTLLGEIEEDNSQIIKMLVKLIRSQRLLTA